MIRLIVIDDDELVRRGIVQIIKDSGIQLVAESNSGENILGGISQYQPDVILLDVRMKSGDGLTALALAKSKYPEIPVLMFSAFDDPIYVSRAVALGASGYLSKTLDREQIIEAIKGAYHGGNSWTRGSEIRKDAEERDLFAESLCKHEGHLDLDGLTELSDAAAESLSNHTSGLGLTGLTSLSKAAAQSLSKYKGQLYLNGITELSDDLVDDLIKYGGGSTLHLTGLTGVSPDGIKKLAMKRELKLSVENFSEEVNEALAEGNHLRLLILSI